jgi:hypothetical protein
MDAAQYVRERPQLVIHYDLTPVRRDRGSRIAAASSIPKRGNGMNQRNLHTSTQLYRDGSFC